MARVTDVSSDVSKSARFGMWFERRMPRLFVLPAVILLLSLGLFPLLYSLGIIHQLELARSGAALHRVEKLR
jgi:hypothetical protein